MPVEITYRGSDDGVLAKVIADGELASTYNGNTQAAIEAAAAAGGITLDYAGSDLNMIEVLAAGIVVGPVYGLSGDVTTVGLVPYETHSPNWRVFTQTLGNDGVSSSYWAVSPNYGGVGDFTTGAGQSGVVVVPLRASLLFDSSAYDGTENGYQVSMALFGTGTGQTANLVVEVGHAGAWEVRLAARANNLPVTLTLATGTLTADAEVIAAVYIEKATGRVGVILQEPGSPATDLGFLTTDVGGAWQPDGLGAHNVVVNDGAKAPSLLLADNAQAGQTITGDVVELEIYCAAADIDALALPLPASAVDIQGAAI